jgi:hypothetical protein
MEAVSDNQIQAYDRASLSIVPCCRPKLDKEDEARIQKIANRLKRDEPALDAGTHFAPLVQRGLSNAPALIFGDQQEISLFSGNAPSRLEYRMAVLAQPGDIFAVHQRDKAFEDYLSKYLNLTDITFIDPQTAQGDHLAPMAIECRTNTHMHSAIDRIARKAGKLQLLAFNTTGNVWRLAQDISERCEVEVSVAGPSPRVARRANNKVWFTNRVRELLGSDALPPTHGVFGPAAAAGHIARLARHHQRVVLKVPDSAGSVGNIAFESDNLSGMNVADIRSNLLEILQSRGWQERYPVLVGVWDCDVVSSPSVQIWTPLASEGLPIVEGVFEQSVQGEAGTFIGARRAALSQQLHDQLVSEAMLFACLFQKLGYYGRCSFDAIISQTPGARRSLHWIECNARWGGVSIPLTLANNLQPSDPHSGFVVVQQSLGDANSFSTEQVINMLDGLLYEHHKSSSGLILLSPPRQNMEMRINFLAITDAQKTAENLADMAITRLLGE